MIKSNDELLEFSHDHPVLFFDGICVLCNKVIKFLLRRDDQKILRYATLQSSLGQMVHAGDQTGHINKDTVILLKKGKVYHKSEVLFELLEYLYPFYKVFYVLRILPLSFRNWVYDKVAASRYGIFGKKASCKLPDPRLKNLFLDL